MIAKVPRPRRILLIQLRRFGDVVLTMPLLSDLRRAYPDARLDFLVGQPAAPLLDNHPFLDERIIIDRKHPLRMWRDIRSRRYDWIIDAQSSPRTAPLSLMSGAPVRVGWGVTGWGWVYTHRLARRSPRPPEYVLRERQRLLELVGVQVRASRVRLYLTDEERARGESDARAAGAKPGVPRVGLLLSTGKPSTQWRVERFAELAESLAKLGVSPTVFQPPADAGLVARFASLTRSAVILPRLDLRRDLGVLSTCNVFVSGDTGPAHMATALDVPTVTIFGPSSPVLWTPGLPTTVAVRGEGDSMAGVSAATVLAGVMEFIRVRLPSALVAP